MDTINYQQLEKMLLGAVAQIKSNVELLSKLDSFGGDGDHGPTMARAMECLAKAVEDSSTGVIKDMLNNVGWAIMGVDGGATGPLFGSFFMGMAKACDNSDTLDVSALAALFESGLASVRTVSKAQPGDTTMIDAIVPAVEQMRTAADSGADIMESLKQACEAAAEGAKATTDMQAKFGRAKNIGEKSKGQPDAGATSVSLVFKGFVEGVQ